ncbi:MAG: uroporphyrinogen decarboxylase/cobalamine-independent methonine synthase family protein [Anaerolineae bacterium]
MTTHAFGNDPAKVERYRAFWQRRDVSRPLVGFSIKSWFPLQEFAASANWQSASLLTPEMVEPEAFLDDQERLLREGETMADDILRGASPSQAVPWLDGMVGSQLRILPRSILGEDRRLSWDELAQIHLDHQNPWFIKYVDFLEVLVRRSAGRFPVSHGTLIGPSDLLAALRGHSQSIEDLLLEPEQASEALGRLAGVFREITEEAWKHLPLCYGGYYDAQYQLWAPRPIIRMQEDASGLYSPQLYRRYLQPIDSDLADHFPSAFIHLHATSMHLLDAFLEIEALRCFQVNYEVRSGGPPVQGMIPYWRRIQEAGRSLLIRGSFTPEEARQLVDALDPRGLYLYIMVDSLNEVETLRPVLGM